MRTTSLLGVVSASVLLAPLATAQSTWPNVNLPTTFQPVSGGFVEDFETAAGVVPSYMALTNIDVATGLVDAEAWCNIGNVAACLAPNGGAYSLEMGLLPGSTNYHDVRNVMVLGLNGAGTTDLYLNFFAHNGGEETDVIDGVKISDDGVNWYDIANPWSSIVATGNAWLPVYNLDLTTTAASTSGDFYLMFAEEDNFPFVAAGSSASDGIGIDDISVSTSQTPIPPPTPVTWSFVNLPTSFESVAGGFVEDFDTAAGVVQPYMAITELDGLTLLPEPNCWANIGQNGPLNEVSNSGSYHLEMSWAPVTSGSESRNALVLGLNGAGATDFDLAFHIWDQFDELDAFDGVWVSDNGTDWTRLYDGNSGSASWTQETGIDMTFQGQNPVNLSGDFYLMFAQDDNTYWNGNDGIGFDDIIVGPLPPTPPVVALNGTCGVNPSSVDVSGATPNGQVAVVAGTVLSAVTVPASRPCAGIQLDVVPIMQYLQIGVADANGDFSVTGGSGAIPANACGLFSVQAVDITTCLTSNVLSL